ncbi:ABC transporter substrate-binding protein [Psychrobacter sp. ASPA161_9]|uniref:ABC transporter substrate-binding protein n=1 Tax=Psychrobacter sp. ASPA161_9 TaxID=3160961 RepID=UPI003F804681
MSRVSLSRLASKTTPSTAIRMFPKALLFAVVGLMLTSCSNRADENVLNLYNWDEYMPQEVIDGFEKETGITVNYTTFDTNKQMYESLKASDESNQYDLAIPSSYFVDKMAKEGLLQELDKSKLSNFKNLDTSFTNTKVDPGNKYSVPYVWGSTGLVIDGTTMDHATVNSWDNLWKPDYKGQVMLMDDMRDVFGMSLLTLGYSVNSSNPDEIKAAYDKLVTLMPNVEGFNSDEPLVEYLAGEANLGMTWNGEAVTANDEGMSGIVFKYPTEGAILWMDNLVIPKNAKNADAAHQFINYLLLPKNAKIISEEVGYAAPNTEARKIMSYEVRNHPTIYPSKEVIAQGEFLADVGEKAIKIYEQYWDKLRAGS